VTGSYLAAKFGGTAGAGLGAAGDAVAVAKMVKGAQLAEEWASVLGAPDAVAATEAEWQTQQTRSVRRTNDVPLIRGRTWLGHQSRQRNLDMPGTSLAPTLR
jgi:hypothetical protein